MKTIQMTIDESLLEDVDRVVATLQTSRSAFFREALVAALCRETVAELERSSAGGNVENPSEREQPNPRKTRGSRGPKRDPKVP